MVSEIRRERLGMLKDQHGLTWAEFNRRLNRLPRDSTLSQLWHAAPDSKTGRPRTMGHTQARAIEQAFALPEGWMDRDPALDVREPAAQYLAWPTNKASLDELAKTLTAEQRAEVMGMIRAFASENARSGLPSKAA